MSIDIIHKTNIIITQTTPTNCTKGLLMILSAIFFNFINKIYERISSSYMNFFRSYYPNFLSNTTSRETYLAIRPIPPFSSIKYANITCVAQLIGVYFSYENTNASYLRQWWECSKDWEMRVPAKALTHLCASYISLYENTTRR